MNVCGEPRENRRSFPSISILQMDRIAGLGAPKNRIAASLRVRSHIRTLTVTLTLERTLSSAPATSSALPPIPHVNNRISLISSAPTLASSSKHFVSAAFVCPVRRQHERVERSVGEDADQSQLRPPAQLIESHLPPSSCCAQPRICSQPTHCSRSSLCVCHNRLSPNVSQATLLSERYSHWLVAC